jgi:hypothetical protein
VILLLKRILQSSSSMLVASLMLMLQRSLVASVMYVVQWIKHSSGSRLV